MRRSDGNDPLDARRPALPKVCPRDQASHAVAHEEDAGGACGSTYRLDLRAELLGKVLDVAVRRAIVEGVDHIDTMPRELAPHGKPNAIVDQYAMHQNNGQLPRSREGIVYHQPMQCHQRPGYRDR